MTRVLPVLAIVLVVACTGEPVDETSSSPATAPATSAPTMSEAGTTTTTDATTTTQPADAVSLVGDSLAATSANYRFSSVVLVGEQTLTTITGNVDGGSVAAEISTGSGAVSYVRTPDGEWVTGADGEWVPLEGEPPVSPPLAALVDANDLRLESGDATGGVLTGLLGPAAGPAQGVPFSLTIQNGLVTEIRYQVESSAGPAQVITTLTDIGVAGTVSAPEGV